MRWSVLRADTKVNKFFQLDWKIDKINKWLKSGNQFSHSFRKRERFRLIFIELHLILKYLQCFPSWSQYFSENLLTHVSSRICLLKFHKNFFYHETEFSLSIVFRICLTIWNKQDKITIQNTYWSSCWVLDVCQVQIWKPCIWQYFTSIINL